MTELTGPELMDHVYQLAEEHHIQLLMDTRMHPQHAFAKPAKCIVVIPFVTNDVTYVVALHELGHVVHPEGALRLHEFNRTARPPVLRNATLLLKEEDAAWSWAREHAKMWNPMMDRVQEFCHGSYKDYAKVVALEAREMQDLIREIIGRLAGEPQPKQA